jgi:hypothetical protein
VSEPKAEKCLAPTFVRDGEGDEGKNRYCELRAGHTGNHSTTYCGKRHDWSGEPKAESELARVLRDLVCIERFDSHPVNREVAETAARLLREMARDFEKYGRHEDGGQNCAYYDEVPCTCGLAAAREKWRLDP